MRGAILGVLIAAVAIGCGENGESGTPTSGGAGGTGGASDSGLAGSSGIAGGNAGASGAAGEAGAAATSSLFGIDCPASAPSSVPADSPRVLILGPDAAKPADIATVLEGMLASDPAFTATQTAGISTNTDTAFSYYAGGTSLMNFFYYPDQRSERLAVLTQPWSYVVLIESTPVSVDYPEFYFEGVRTLGCTARAVGAKPVVLMPWVCATSDADVRGEIAYRVANGTASILAPMGYAWQSAQSGSAQVPACLEAGNSEVFVAAATLYSTLFGRNASATGYTPDGLTEASAAALADGAYATVSSEAKKVHYQGAYDGVVQLEQAPTGSDFWFMDSGTSSEHIWYQRMNEILPRIGLLPHGTEIGVSNAQKSFDQACLDNAAPYFEKQQYLILLARSYDLDATTIATAGNQNVLQAQLWDRHADSDPSDGIAAVETMEFMSENAYSLAKARGLALVPNHLMFSKLKTMRPSVQLLSDGVHATYPVGYGLAAMSVVSRTGIHVPTDGLDPDTALAADLADETIRQLSSLSVTGVTVPDDPASRPGP